MQSKNHTGGSHSSAVHNDSRGARHAHAGGSAAAHAATELGEVREELGTLGETARESVHSLVEGGSRVARSAATAARGAVDSLREEGVRRFDGMTKRTRKQIEDNPFAAVGIAALAGALLAGGYLMLRRRG